ncbi:hypothetical protein LEMLEM_LOCUS22299 [Lemmus lemmus]
MIFLKAGSSAQVHLFGLTPSPLLVGADKIFAACGGQQYTSSKCHHGPGSTFSSTLISASFSFSKCVR